jgi:diaminopimelate decarboxylase
VPGTGAPAQPPVPGQSPDAVAGVEGALRTAARRYGTPVFVMDGAALDTAAETLAAAFPDPWIRQHSLKANDVAGVVAHLALRGLGANVVSRGEWAIAGRAGIPNSRITLEGIGKTRADLAAAVRASADGDPLLWLAVESTDELAELAELASAAGLRDGTALDVLVRFNPDVAPQTHPGLAVGHGASKFGMAETELTEAVAIIGRLPGRPLRARGIHLHVGSQLGAVDAWRDAVRRSLAVLGLVRGGLAAFDTLDVGGGFPAGPAGSVPEPERFARELPALLDGIPVDRRPSRWAVEPGRRLVAPAGWLVASVLHVRERGQDRDRVVILDAGMTELIRPALYGARHEMLALTSLGRPAASGTTPDAVLAARVDGPVCESTDTFGVDYRLPPLRRGDLVAIADAGAYAASMGSTYNGRPRPPQVMLDPGGRLRLLRRRGSLASLG